MYYEVYFMLIRLS